MATISRVRDLLPLLAAVETADDPVAAVEQQGHVLSPTLKTRLRTRRALTPARRRLVEENASKAGAVRVTVGRRPRIAPRQLSPNEYEFSAGVRMPVANEILAGVYASGTIPDVLFLDQLLPDGARDTLQNFFRVDRPGGRIGRLLITGPPTISQVRDGFDGVALTIPFQLNFERIFTVLFNQVRTVVTSATGRMRLVVKLVAETDTERSGARVLRIQLDLSAASEARLDIDPGSPVQLVNPPTPGQIDILAAVLQNELRQRLGGSLRLTVSAAIPLPIGKLEIRKVTSLTRGDALLVGVKVVGTVGLGDPDTLVPLFPNEETNFFTRVHDEVLRLIIKSALRDGILTRQAKQVHPDAVIESADVAFGKDTIKLIAGGKIVDLCPANVDLGFTVTVTVTVTMEGTRIRIQKETSKNVDNTDAILCAITTLGLALLTVAAVLVFQGIGIASGISAGLAFGVIAVLTAILQFEDEDFDLVFGGGGEEEPTFIELDFPFPGTDLLPTLTGNFIRLDESTMLVAAHLGTRPDDLNTYFYVRFMEADPSGPVAIARAMKGARVRLLDRDLPPPAGDDVTLPGPSTTHSVSETPAGTFEVTTETRFERTADETFGEGTTDHTGRVRIYIPRDKLGSKAGMKVVKTTRVNLDTERETTSTRRTAVPEPRPDFYFRVTRPDGSAVDTLQLGAGFFTNFQSARIGTPANPFTVTFSGIGPIVVDPGVQ